MSFELDARLDSDTFLIGDLPLCRVLLMNDSRYPWVILVPRRSDKREIYELSKVDGAALWKEVRWFGEALMTLFRGDKLNVGALGNMVPQLHVHLIVRHRADAAWPAPVWGKHPPQPYTQAVLDDRLQRLSHLVERYLEENPSSAPG